MAIVRIVPPASSNEPIILTNPDARLEAKKAADAIGRSFVWDQTREGLAFWGSVKRRLEQIADDGELR